MFEQTQFTQLLVASRSGDQAAWSSLMRMVYADLKRIARSHMGAHQARATLGTTGLVHECYLRLAGPASGPIENRRHFLNLASRVMRQVLCDFARQRLSDKRGGGLQREELDAVDDEESAEAEHLVHLDGSLNQLEKENARWARIVECRFFAGLTEEETAEALDMTVRTVQRDWHAAREWLAERMN